MILKVLATFDFDLATPPIMLLAVDATEDFIQVRAIAQLKQQIVRIALAPAESIVNPGSIVDDFGRNPIPTITRANPLHQVSSSIIRSDLIMPVVVRKESSRLQLLRFTANRPACRIGMEACGESQFLGRALKEHAHDVRLIPAQYVKPFVKTNKNDFLDAETIAKAMAQFEKARDCIVTLEIIYVLSLL